VDDALIRGEQYEGRDGVAGMLTRQVRALVLSDTHFGAWTGDDILREPETLALLEPHLDVDEVIFIGDLFDFLFGSVRGAFASAEGLFDLLREKLQGGRFVFLAGNHDHHFVVDQAVELLQLELLTGKAPDELRGESRRLDFFHRFLTSRLDGVEVDIRYPAYTFAGVLCTHGHYLDFYARRNGAAGGRLLARVLWAISVGGDEHTPTVQDYEATITLLTSLLYTIAQLPNGTRAQRRVFRGFQALERAVRTGEAPMRAMDELTHWVGVQTRAHRNASSRHEAEATMAAYKGARNHEADRRRRTGAPTGGESASYAMARVVRPSDPSGPAIDAFEKVVMNLGWARDTDRIVFAHTHQPLNGVVGPSRRVRYWNAGSWIYEPDLTSKEAYRAYVRNAWPGSAVLIDSDEPHPRLLRLREHLKPVPESDS
jgi:UDP-2,3-diacylglucosamine pyrophosphatase LpxH